MDLLDERDYDSAWVGEYGCKSPLAPNQEWYITTANAPSNADGSLGLVTGQADSLSQKLYTLAFDYAVTQCGNNEELCDFRKTSESPITVTDCKVLGSMNNTQATTSNPLTVSSSHTETWGNSVGTEVSTAFENTFGLPLVGQTKVTVTLKFAYSHNWGASDTSTKTDTLNVPAGNWGVIMQGTLGVVVTGDWTFYNLPGGASWHVTGTHSIPLPQGSDNSFAPFVHYTGTTYPSNTHDCGTPTASADTTVTAPAQPGSSANPPAQPSSGSNPPAQPPASGTPCLTLDGSDRLVKGECSTGSTPLQAHADGTVHQADLCLSVDNSLTIHGHPTVLPVPCDGSDYQVWRLRPDGAVENAGSHDCLTESGSDTGHMLYLDDCARATRLANYWPAPPRI